MDGGKAAVDVRETERVREKYDRRAAYYDLMEAAVEPFLAGLRRRLWQRARGLVLEIGVGTGKNLAFYPPGVRVVAIDFSPEMLKQARRRSQRLGVEVDLRLMDAQNLEFPDQTFDTIITSCVFCSVPDPVLGLREARRVCKPDGQILMLEHVRSEGRVLGPAMDLLDPPFARLTGVHINRRTVQNLQRAGWKVVEVERVLGDVVLLIRAEP